MRPKPLPMAVYHSSIPPHADFGNAKPRVLNVTPKQREAALMANISISRYILFDKLKEKIKQ
ncbi:MAG: hypothetical protein N2645_19530 [Clostridia bacterium]|nr:hypothetical protein [Clostridia bacterium]